MKTIVIAADRSGAGKTTLARFICGLVPQSVRIKIGHGTPRSKDDGFFYPSGTSFGYIAAAHAEAPLLVIESNSILAEMTPDVVIFLTADNPKPSAAIARRKADIVRGERVAPEVIERLTARVGIGEGVMRKIAWFAGARPEPVTGIVLAGGKSSRMGTDKAMLEIDGIPMAFRCRDQIAPYSDGILFSVNRHNAEKFAGCATVVDSIEDQGPLGGIIAGLSASHTDINLVVACDIPYIDPFVLFTLLSYCDEYDIVVPSFAPATQEPLYGVYRSSVAVAAGTLLVENKYRVSELFGRCRTKMVPLNDRGRYANLNTEEDVEWYIRRLNGQVKARLSGM